MHAGHACAKARGCAPGELTPRFGALSRDDAPARCGGGTPAAGANRQRPALWCAGNKRMCAMRGDAGARFHACCGTSDPGGPCALRFTQRLLNACCCAYVRCLSGVSGATTAVERSPSRRSSGLVTRPTIPLLRLSPAFTAFMYACAGVGEESCGEGLHSHVVSAASPCDSRFGSRRAHHTTMHGESHLYTWLGGRGGQTFNAHEPVSGRSCASAPRDLQRLS